MGQALIRTNEWLKLLLKTEWKLLSKSWSRQTPGLFDGKYKLENDGFRGRENRYISVLTSNTLRLKVYWNIMKGEHPYRIFAYIPRYVRIGQPLATVVTDWDHEKLFHYLKTTSQRITKKSLENEKTSLLTMEAKGLFKLKLRAATSNELNTPSNTCLTKANHA